MVRKALLLNSQTSSQVLGDKLLICCLLAPRSTLCNWPTSSLATRDLQLPHLTYTVDTISTLWLFTNFKNDTSPSY